MKRLCSLAAGLLLTLALTAPASAAAPAAGPSTTDPTITRVLTPVRVLTHAAGLGLQAGSAVKPLAGGAWHAGCQMDGYNSTGGHVWTYTVWQDYSSSDGKSIKKPPPPAEFTEWSAFGWDWFGNPAHPTQWWITNFSVLAAQGSYTFKLIIGGQTLNTTSGYVRTTVKANGTWTCSGA